MGILQRTVNFLLFLAVLHDSYSQGQEDIVPNIAAFPDGPPAPGDVFDQPMEVTNANEQVDALGETVTEAPTLGDPALPPSPVIDTLPNEPVGLVDNADLQTIPPPADGELLVGPTNTGDNVPVGAVDTVDIMQGEPTLIESGSDVMSVGDGVMAVDSLQTTTPIVDADMTTVDSNFDPQGTFDGRSDPILLTGTTLPSNKSGVLETAGNVLDSQDVVATVPGQDTINEIPTGRDTETTTPGLDLVPETESINVPSVTDLNAVNVPVNAADNLTPEDIPDITKLTDTVGNDMTADTVLNTADSSTPLINEIQNTVEKPSLVDQTPPTDFGDVPKASVPNYEEKLKEYNEFVQKNPNTSFPAPPKPPPREIGPPGPTDVVDTASIPPSEPIIETTSLPPSEPILQPGETTDVIPDNPTSVSTLDTQTLVENASIPPTDPIIETEPPVPVLKTDAIAQEPSLPPSDPILPTENVVRKIPQPVEPTLGSAKVTRPSPATRPTVNDRIKSRPSFKPVSIASPPSLPPPPSEVFRKDFNEIVRKKTDVLDYKPAIPFDPDFDFRPIGSTKTANLRSTVTKTTKEPTSRQLDVQSIYEKNSLQKNSFPFATEETRKRQQESMPRQRDGGMPLIQYQLSHKNDNALARRTSVRERANNPTTVRRNQISSQGSNDMQALFDKNRKFVARFGEPGMPISSDYFNQNQYNFGGAQTNNENKPNSLGSQQFGTVWSSKQQTGRRSQNNQKPISRNTMPPIVVVEDGSRNEQSNTVSDSRSSPETARFQTRDFQDRQNNMVRTNAPSFGSKRDNSFEMWYQLMGKDYLQNDIKNFQSGQNSAPDSRNMGGRVLNRIWNSNTNRNQIGQNTLSRNDRVNNELFRRQAGGLASTSSKPERLVRKSNAFVFEPKQQRFQTANLNSAPRQEPEPTIQTRNNNAFAFRPEEPRVQRENTRKVQRRESQKPTAVNQQRVQRENTRNTQRKETTKPTVSRNNAFVFEPQKQQFQVGATRKVQRQTGTSNPERKNNAFVFEPKRAQIEVADPHRMIIKEYIVTEKPNTVSTTEAQLNMGFPTLSYALEPGKVSQDNPPPINIDGNFDIAFQSFITTTARPNSLPQPTSRTASAFRNRQRTTQTMNESFRRGVDSIANLPRPPPIKPLSPSFSGTPKSNTERNRALIQNRESIDIDPKLNAVPFVPAEPMGRSQFNKISDLPRPPAIDFAKSAGNGMGGNTNVGPPPLGGAQVFKAIPEVTPVPPIFTINSTFVKVLQNYSVTKEELHSSVCHQCHYVSDVCFLTEAQSCNRFVECHRNGDQVRAFEKECAIGNFWNPETLACQKSVYVDCSSDPCKNPSVKSHPFLGRCRYFWKCDQRENVRSSEFKFCSQNYRYDGTADTCVVDFSCKDEDPPMDVVQPSVPEKCIWTAVDGSFTSFTDGFNTQKCAPGTRFDEVQCTCIISNITPEGEVCNPDTLIDFEGGDVEAFIDKSGHRNGIGKEDVRLKDGTGFFYGRGKLSFWRYSNVELGPLLGIQIRFFPYGYSKNPMALVSNCNGSPIGATVDIRLDTKTKRAIFKLSTNKQQNNEIVLPYEPFKWNTATYVYAGDTFTASINDKKETIPVEGSIPNRHPAIQIGGCSREDGFRGYADDVKVYNGCIPDEFEYIIFT